MDAIDIQEDSYKDLLKLYIDTEDEKALYGAEKISKSFIKQGITPEEIVNLHIQSLQEMYDDMPQAYLRGLDFLLETMISYGLALQEYQTLREKQLEIKSELKIAAGMQKTLLATTVPVVENLQIGVVSVAAHQMNGDYHHFITGKNGDIGIALADVRGKGIPAALCMSMIKYAMDSLPEDTMGPNKILKNLNRVVEKNVDPSMFITMFYAQYFPQTSKFLFSSAGHEPGFYYHGDTKNFEELKTKGLVLGVTSETDYPEYERTIKEGDMIVLLTDGVTECRYGDNFLSREEVLEVIQQHMHLPAQEMAEKVYKHFERLQNFHLRDDFTLIILKK
ncbi:PP2C family protein-serine/threonine phosphatase [Virgibacillus sp. 179-BFC.A HS]|uniref:PP2C family protein-serine/threonine phosphatase n=1 Tax=Tigheibacillus jepli TaxID=3035914 RepID=A0ABU5CKM2_9BACI|nr:PP2C family protein-serine/threonine phosphatase [Virgibacillus sp. 179-BFC.A HS]MDY0406893.1 PP2C family protein-serine/threonine phosphatase [Virgibacillus sp. 179-BFC.A HS]